MWQLAERISATAAKVAGVGDYSHFRVVPYFAHSLAYV
jgi:hypothetical protein